MHNAFKPDLVIEATSVCDRACIGCYAPNVVSKESSRTLLQTKPSLFLLPEDLALTVAELDLTKKIVSIRGGEPTRNPLLPELLKVLTKTGARPYLETHGRWLIDEDDQGLLLRSLVETDTNVKLSFDSMHGTSREELASMIAILHENSIPCSVAITEASSDLFVKVLSSISSLAIEEIYFQTKATTLDALVRPSIGVVGVDGLLKKSLNSKLESTEFALQRKSVAI
jgi:organic radical activating enzyme